MGGCLALPAAGATIVGGRPPFGAGSAVQQLSGPNSRFELGEVNKNGRVFRPAIGDDALALGGYGSVDFSTRPARAHVLIDTFDLRFLTRASWPPFLPYRYFFVVVRK